MRCLNSFPDHQICRASFFHIVNWFKNLQIRLFTVAWHRVAWVTLGDIR